MKKTLLVLALVIGGGWYFVTTPPSDEVSIAEFDPYRLADLELQMWQAYYDRDTVRLFRLLVVTLREQYDYSWLNAVSAAFDLARAASSFAELRSNYQNVLPDLESAYTTARDWLGAGFDPAEVARAELAWWVARRIPGKDRPDQVGALIADEYALLYETPRDNVMRAAQLRAEAAALRDRQAESPDWDRIGKMLAESYVELYAALNR
ncbi:MAG: hypothetical protein HYU37_22460 [Acidobacteria bacterium]|nr:hypothetical protein [Acidobacteriota bacterium]